MTPTYTVARECIPRSPVSFRSGARDSGLSRISFQLRRMLIVIHRVRHGLFVAE